MMSPWKSLAIGLLLIASLPLLLHASSESNGAAAKGESKQARPANEPQSDGERKFQQNCGRCHNAPESFSPHVSGTIVRHMRARASLSKQDEQEILHFLNP